jgi:hypothetical protein
MRSRRIDKDGSRAATASLVILAACAVVFAAVLIIAL